MVTAEKKEKPYEIVIFRCDIYNKNMVNQSEYNG